MNARATADSNGPPAAAFEPLRARKVVRAERVVRSNNRSTIDPSSLLDGDFSKLTGPELRDIMLERFTCAGTTTRDQDTESASSEGKPEAELPLTKGPTEEDVQTFEESS